MQRPVTILWVLLVGLFAWLAVAYADTLTVTVSRANVRQGPGLTHGVVTTVPRGATFPVLSTQGGWHRILLDDGREAWIAATTVRLDASGRALQRVEPAAQRRVALVIGNAAYADSPLRNPVNDATDMAAALRQMGFEVTLLRDARRRQMNDAVRAFGRQLRQGGVGLFYFAGHGLQVAGQNYLVPIGADIEEEFEVSDEAVSAGRILGAMEAAGNGLNLVILDACRNNPYSRGFRGRSARGLAAPAQAARGSLIAYATSPNAVAADGSGRNGLYTKHLLRYMQEPGLGVEEMFKKVRIAVERESGGQQTPWELSSLPGDFSFTVSSTAGSGDSGDAERRRLEAERRRRKREAQERGLGLEMVRVEGGGFTIGCQSWRDGTCYEDEKPAHWVRVRSFEIGKYEVTQAQWEAVMGRNPSRFLGCAKCPVERVSWHDVQAFLAKLNARTGGGYRLPTESEWEYAARGGQRSRNYRYAGGNDMGSVGWHGDNSGDRTHPMGGKRANELGLHDMSGNVWEWVQDCWNENYQGAPADGRAWTSGDCSRRVVRGGSWVKLPRGLRSANRLWNVTGNRSSYLGFRLTRTLTP